MAELTQEELNDFHPGPDRGVKQGVLAVLTNAVMPSVLVETGYLSHQQEARLLADRDFQVNAARAISRAVERFFERYPPGSSEEGR
jgi:N-acetylmuramoyl-L-alanine amidase